MAIFSALQNLKKQKSTYLGTSEETAEKEKMLLAMMMRERDLDDKYMAKNYNSHVSLLNQDRLTLVNKTFFE